MNLTILHLPITEMCLLLSDNAHKTFYGVGFNRMYEFFFPVIQQLPKVWLFFGCRTQALDLYCDEKQEMVEKRILDRVFLALSREPDVPKVCYYQEQSSTVYVGR